MEFTARIYTDGSVETPGIDFGPKGLTVWEVTREFATFKTSPHSSWSGRGMTSYRPVGFVVCRVLRGWTEGSISVLRVEQVTSFPAAKPAANSERVKRVATALEGASK
jgi:hypothetical protein